MFKYFDKYFENYFSNIFFFENISNYFEIILDMCFEKYFEKRLKIFCRHPTTPPPHTHFDKGLIQRKAATPFGTDALSPEALSIRFSLVASVNDIVLVAPCLPSFTFWLQLVVPVKVRDCWFLRS